jgi:hypothetical protein
LRFPISPDYNPISFDAADCRVLVFFATDGFEVISLCEWRGERRENRQCGLASASRGAFCRFCFPRRNDKIIVNHTQSLCPSHSEAATVCREVELRVGACRFRIQSPAWRNWQTRWTQNPVAARPCGFEPLRRQRFSIRCSISNVERSIQRRSCNDLPMLCALIIRKETLPDGFVGISSFAFRMAFAHSFQCK